MKKYIVDKKWTSGGDKDFIHVEPTTKKELKTMAYVYAIDKPLIKYHPEIAGFFYGKYLCDSPEHEEVFFLRKAFSLGNREKSDIRAARWLRRHGMEAGYDEKTGRIKVWPKNK